MERKRTPEGFFSGVVQSILVAACFLAAAASAAAAGLEEPQKPPEPMPPAAEPEVAQEVIPLREAIAQLSADLAALPGPYSECLIGCPPGCSLLEGYVSCQLVVHLERRGITTREFKCLPKDADARLSERLKMRLLRELRSEDTGLFVLPVASVEDGSRYLTATAYEIAGGRKLKGFRVVFHLPEEMAALVSGERSRIAQ
ncbi:unnamed protein product, partial [marine sediment metagenome]